MAFQNEAQILNDLCINTFGTAASFYSQSATSTAVAITGIFEKVPMLDEVMPGLGTSIARFFVSSQDITPTPTKGDKVVINGTTYNVGELETDATGGSTLILRIRG